MAVPCDEDVGLRTAALAHWCEGFLHGLVSVKHADALKERLAAEPLAEFRNERKVKTNE